VVNKACSTDGVEQECLEVYGVKARRKETTRMAKTKTGILVVSFLLAFTP
jgi:hypothetical protein